LVVKAAKIGRKSSQNWSLNKSIALTTITYPIALTKNLALSLTFFWQDEKGRL